MNKDEYDNFILKSKNDLMVELIFNSRYDHLISRFNEDLHDILDSLLIEEKIKDFDRNQIIDLIFKDMRISFD